MAKAIKFKNSSNEEIYPCPFFPVGFIYLSTTEINPSIYFGGTWERIKDRFLLTAGNNYSAGATGGEASVKLSVANLPSHSHSGTTNTDGHHRHEIAYYSSGAGQASNNDFITNSGMGWSTNYRLNEWITFAGNNKSAHCHNFTTGNTGSTTAHNNMPPYLVVYAWKRVK